MCLRQKYFLNLKGTNWFHCNTRYFANYILMTESEFLDSVIRIADSLFYRCLSTSSPIAFVPKIILAAVLLSAISRVR